MPQASVDAPCALRRGVCRVWPVPRPAVAGSDKHRHIEEAPMARPDKSAAVEEITERFRGSSASVITEYRGLTVAQLAELRRALGGSASYRVAKNTLVTRAAAEAGVEGLDQLLVGPTAIAFVTGEPVEAAKALKAFARDHKGLVIKGGVMDGHPLTTDEV